MYEVAVIVVCLMSPPAPMCTTFMPTEDNQIISDTVKGCHEAGMDEARALVASMGNGRIRYEARVGCVEIGTGV